MRPYVLVNVAATVDGKLDTVARRGAAISSDADRERVQRAHLDELRQQERAAEEERQRRLFTELDWYADPPPEGLKKPESR